MADEIERFLMQVGLNTPLKRGVVTGGLSAGALYYFKPKLMFDASGKARAFGTKTGETVLPWWLASAAVGGIFTLFV